MNQYFKFTYFFMGLCGNFLPCIRFKVVCMDLGEKKKKTKEDTHT